MLLGLPESDTGRLRLESWGIFLINGQIVIFESDAFCFLNRSLRQARLVVWWKMSPPSCGNVALWASEFSKLTKTLFVTVGRGCSVNIITLTLYPKII